MHSNDALIYCLCESISHAFYFFDFVFVEEKRTIDKALAINYTQSKMDRRHNNLNGCCEYTNKISMK